MNNAYSSFGKFSAQGLGSSWSLTSQNKFERLTVSCLKGSEATIAAKSDGKLLSLTHMLYLFSSHNQSYLPLLCIFFPC